MDSIYCKNNIVGKCDIHALSMPENAEYWSCNKPVDQGKVEKYTRCKIVCLEGYDFSKGKKWRSSITHDK